MCDVLIVILWVFFLGVLLIVLYDLVFDKFFFVNIVVIAVVKVVLLWLMWLMVLILMCFLLWLKFSFVILKFFCKNIE